MDDEIDSNDEMDKVSRDSIDDEITGVPTKATFYGHIETTHVKL